MSQVDITPKQMEAIKHIRNYIVHRNRPPSIRELMRALGYNSIKSIQNILLALESMGIIQKLGGGDYRLILNPDLGHSHVQTVDVPIVGIASCGAPILAEQNIEGYIPISTSLARLGKTYFLLHAKGDSMDEAGINDGDLVLIRQQSIANEGDKIVALINDEATIKEFHRGIDVVVLKPQSSNPKHKPIILEDEFQIQGVVVTVIPKEVNV